jgi:outer membrane cobalamin receptor
MKFSLLCLFFLFAFQARSQDSVLRGFVYDADSGDPIPGANVITKDFKGTSTDINGLYELSLVPGKYSLTYSFIGYQKQTKEVELLANQTITVNVYLQVASLNLDIVVVSAGKFEQDLGEVTMSMEVLQPDMIENKNTTSMEDVLQQAPGVSIVNGEPQIRSGSGYSFGAGSRVMILVDDLPILSGDAGRPTWGFLPVENVEQIEIIKGASSVLYGSAALSGVINVRTSYPKEKPRTKVNVFHGVFSHPKSKEAVYWDGYLMQSGMSFLHARRINNWDLTIAANVLGDDSYKGPVIDPVTVDTASSRFNPFSVDRYDADTRARINANVRYRSKKMTGLSLGVNTNWMKGESLATLLWDNSEEGLYSAYAGAATRTKQVVGTVDPFVEYVGAKGSKHTLRTRWQTLDNDNDNDQGNFSDVYFGEYQFQQRFDTSLVKDFTLTTGVTGTKTVGISQLFSGGNTNGSNEGKNVAAYLQLDKKFIDKLTLSAGIRFENYSINEESASQPVFRAGANYQFGQASYLRASYGQGFRFPSIAEKFIETAVGDISIYANPDLQPETSYNMEVGVKQGFIIGAFKGFADLAVFQQEYDNLIEFTFGQWGGPGTQLGGLGFKSLNTGKSRVRGAEISILGTGEIGKTTINLLAGYTYTLPQSLTPDYVYGEASNENVDKPVYYTNTSSDPTNNILKYRFQHLVRADIELNRDGMILGASLRYNSHLQNIDLAFLEIEMFGFAEWGLTSWRANHTSGDYVVDMRVGYKVNSNHRIMLIVGNLLNREYAIRPLAIEPPRLTTLQYTYSFQ